MIDPILYDRVVRVALAERRSISGAFGMIVEDWFDKTGRYTEIASEHETRGEVGKVSLPDPGPIDPLEEALAFIRGTRVP